MPGQGHISGRILVSGQEDTPLPYASIRLLQEKDSAFVAGTTSNEEGLFELKPLKKNRYILIISCIGYKTTEQKADLTGKSGSAFLGDIFLPENTIALAEASVVAQRREMTVKEDTIEYDAAAYKMRDNAVVEDLLKRLPGISIDEEGRILVNGKEVKKVMVDGKDFFRSNPNLTIRNIPVNILEKLQVIDDVSELAKLTGIDDGEENTVINITIQKDKKRGWLSNNNVGIGQEFNSDDNGVLRYTVNSFVARLHQDTQFGVVVNGNNINGMTLGGGGSTTGNDKPGLNSSLSTGINFSSGKKDISPWVLNGDISYGQNTSYVNRNSIRQYYLQDSTSYQTDTVNQQIHSREIRFSAKIENRSLDGWVFSFNPTASYTFDSRINDGNTLLQAGTPGRDSVNMNSYHHTARTPGFDLRGVFTVSRNFAKKGRKLSLNIDSRYTSSTGSGVTQADYYYFRRKPENRHVNRDQEWETSAGSFNNRLYLSYIEPIAPKQSLQFVYWIRSNNREQIKNNFRPDEWGEYTILDLPYSKSIENTTITQQIGVSYKGVMHNTVYTFGVDFNPAYIRSRSFIQNGAASGADSTIMLFPGLRTYNFAPNGYLKYNMGKGKNLRFDYRGRSESPSVSQLDPSRNESNPTHIRIGNPDLRPKFTHWTRLRYTDNNKLSRQSIRVNLEGNYILNDIINYTNYDGETGIKTTQPVNQSGSWNATGTFMYNRPISNAFQVNNLTNAGMRNAIGYSTVNNQSGSEKTTATTATFNEELGLTFKWEWLYLMAKTSYEFSNTSYSIQSMLDKKISTLGGFFTAQCSLPKEWTISSDVNFRSITGFSSEYDRNELIWNAEISKNFMKNSAGTLTLLFNDILQQQLSFSQVISSNFVEDRQFNTLKSFIMLAFTYKFSSMGKN